MVVIENYHKPCSLNHGKCVFLFTVLKASICSRGVIGQERDAVLGSQFFRVAL